MNITLSIVLVQKTGLLPFQVGAFALNQSEIPHLAVFFAAVAALTAIHAQTFVVAWFGVDGVRRPVLYISRRRRVARKN